MPHPHKIGDEIDFSPGDEDSIRIPCIIMEVDEEGYIIKLRARDGNNSLCRHGFIYEEPYYIVGTWDFSDN